MQDNITSREKILKKVRKALTHKSPIEMGDVDKSSEIFTTSEEPLEIQFAQNFTAVNGKFIFCENEIEFIENFKFLANDYKWKEIFCSTPELKSLLTGKVMFSSNEKKILKADVGITLCECLIARTGSVMISSKQTSGRRLPIFSNYHIVVAYTSQLLLNTKDGLKLIKEKYGRQLPSMISFITGPSSTADIEKTIVLGAHGPKEIFLFLIDNIPLIT